MGGKSLITILVVVSVLLLGGLSIYAGQQAGSVAVSMQEVSAQLRGDPQAVLQQSAETLQGMKNTMMIVAVVIMALSVSLFFFFYGAVVSRPLGLIRRMVSPEGKINIDESDIDMLDGELADVAQGLMNYTKKVKAQWSNISDIADRCAAAVNDLSDDSQEGAFLKQKEEIDKVATAMNEMSATVQEVARNATEAAEAAHRADSETTNGKNVVAQAIEAIDLLANEVDDAAKVINRLENDSEEIGAILDVIRGIAEQTNLLALNAAIEAARAGEQGRGFAVVADEVWTLAQRTQQSIQEIQNMIERLQAGAQEAVKAMQQGRTRAQAGVEQAAAAGTSLETITAAVGTISDMNAQIATAAEEQSVVAEEINLNITSISDMSDKMVGMTKKTRTSRDELKKLIEELIDKGRSMV
jgi:methyl-accepting chemotaxis protein